MCLGGLGECSGEILEVFCHDRNLGFRGGERRRMVVSGFDEEHMGFSGFIRLFLGICSSRSSDVHNFIVV